MHLVVFVQERDDVEPPEVGSHVVVLSPWWTARVPSERVSGLRDLTALVNEKLDLDVLMSLQRVLRAWLVTHIPAAVVLLGLLVVHVFAVVYF